MEDIKITERGWCGYLKGYADCLFRRNTLIEYRDKKVVVATLGNYIDWLNEEVSPVKDSMWYVTIAGYATKNEGYWDMDPQRRIKINGRHYITGTFDELLATYECIDETANDMHEAIVVEMMDRICEEL